MAVAFEVILSPNLKAAFSDWSEDDRYKLLALVELLEEYGFDAIINAVDKGIDWFAVEFVEPGEIPDMLWARAFIDLEEGSYTLRITFEESVLEVDSG